MNFPANCARAIGTGIQSRVSGVFTWTTATPACTAYVMNSKNTMRKPRRIFLSTSICKSSINPESNVGIVGIDGQNITDLFLLHRCDSRFEIELVPGAFQQRVHN